MATTGSAKRSADDDDDAVKKMSKRKRDTLPLVIIPANAKEAARKAGVKIEEFTAAEWAYFDRNDCDGFSFKVHQCSCCYRTHKNKTCMCNDVGIMYPETAGGSYTLTMCDCCRTGQVECACLIAETNRQRPVSRDSSDDD